MKIVLDTNVLVSAFLNPGGKPADILNLILNEKIVLYYDDRIINEYRDVLSRTIFGFETSDINSVISYFKHSGERIDPVPLGIVLEDPDDLMFYEVLVAADASFLITGNVKHFKSLRDNRIVLPAKFLQRYFKQ